MDTIARYNSNDHYSFDTIGNSHDGGHRSETKHAAKLKTTVLTGDFGGGWYHDAAIKDANEAHAHPYR